MVKLYELAAQVKLGVEERKGIESAWLLTEREKKLRITVIKIKTVRTLRTFLDESIVEIRRANTKEEMNEIRSLHDSLMKLMVV